MKKFILEIIDGEEKVEISKDTYYLVAVALLENFIEERIINNDILGEEKNK